MSTQGNTTLIQGIPQITDAFVVIVKTEWNAEIINKLSDSCEEVLAKNGVAFKTLVVPGAVELPFAVQSWANSAQRKADAFIIFGTVIRGGTPHFDYVCKIVSEGTTQLNLLLDVPTIFGVLTVDNEQQAIDRAGGSEGNKGEEAGITAIKMIALNREIKA